MRSFTVLASLAVLAGLVTPARARAQCVPACFPDLAGEWQQKLQTGAVAEYRLPAAEAARFTRRLEALAGVIHAAPVLQPPRGIQPRLRAYVSYRQEGDSGRASRQPVQGRETVELYFYFADRNGKPFWGGENLTVADFWVNDPLMTLGAEHDLRYEGLPLPDGRRIRYMPVRTGELGGFPVYDEKRVIVSRSTRPLWVPVTREQYLSALVRAREQDLAGAESGFARDPYTLWLSERGKRERTRDEIYKAVKARSAQEAEQFLRTAADMETRTEAALKATPREEPASLRTLRNGVAGLRSELAAMAPAERNSQAWIARLGDVTSGLLPAGTSGARALVAVNWDFLDRSRPRADWQLVTAVFEPGVLRNNPGHVGSIRLKQLRESTDWRKVATLLD